MDDLGEIRTQILTNKQVIGFALRGIILAMKNDV